jgi:hypothetical protein
MTIKYTNILHSKTLQNLPKFFMFGLKIYHLATLLKMCFPYQTFTKDDDGHLLYFEGATLLQLLPEKVQKKSANDKGPLVRETTSVLCFAVFCFVYY